MGIRGILSITALVAGGFGRLAWGAADDVLAEAANRALEEARTAIAAAPKLEGVKRIGVASLEGESADITNRIKSMLTKTAHEVVLTSDADWGALLDEFARQVKREDLILKETAHELRVQGVDAVLFGTVEKSDVEPVREGGRDGHRATVRLLLNIASLSEENPGSLLWSEEVKGMADDLATVEARPEAQMIDFVVRWRLPLAVLGLLLVGFVLWRFYRAATTPR